MVTLSTSTVTRVLFASASFSLKRRQISLRVSICCGVSLRPSCSSHGGTGIRVTKTPLLFREGYAGDSGVTTGLGR